MSTATQGSVALRDDQGTVTTSAPDFPRRPFALVDDAGVASAEGRSTRTDVRADATALVTAEIARSGDAPPPLRDRRATLFQLLQKWDGVVRSCSDREFTAVLYDVTDQSRPELEATFDLDEVSAGDLPLVAPGALFRYQIGYETARGTKRTVSELQFKRIPPPTRAERNRARREAARLLDLLGD